MLTFYQLEECPHCEKVRRFMSQHNIAAQVVYVPRLGSERAKQIAEFPQLETAEVPLLVDGDTVLQDTEEILAYLRSKYVTTQFGDPTYGLTRTLEGLSFADAVGAVKAALATEGFGVLTEIDVKATMKKKLDVDFAPYVILGACNPNLAHQALSEEPALGLLLPCNVVVTEEAGKTVVSAVDPKQMFKVVGNEAIESVAQDVRVKLARALQNIEG